MTSKKALLINATDDTNQTIKIHNELQKRYLDIKIISKDTPIKPNKAIITRSILNLISNKDSNLCIYYYGDAQDSGLDVIDKDDKGVLTFEQIKGLLSFTDKTSKLVVIMDITTINPFKLAFNLDKESRIVEEKRGDRIARIRKEFLVLKNNGVDNLSPNIIVFSECNTAPTPAYTACNFMGGLSFCLFLSLLEKTNDDTFHDLLKCIKQKLDQNSYPQSLVFSTSISDIFNVKVEEFF